MGVGALLDCESPRKRKSPKPGICGYRGVSCYKRTGRWEAHIWASGKQIHLGSFRTPEDAARAYDMAAINFRGWDAETNFNPDEYRDNLTLVSHMASDCAEDFIAWLRRGGKEGDSLTPYKSKGSSGDGECGTPVSKARRPVTTRSRKKESVELSDLPDATAYFNGIILPGVPVTDWGVAAPFEHARDGSEAEAPLLACFVAPAHGEDMASLVPPPHLATHAIPTVASTEAFSDYGELAKEWPWGLGRAQQ